jgi:CSLREA domain-containing protein
MALGFMLALAIAGLLLAAKPAHAAEFTVNSTNDTEDVDPGDGVCAVNNIPGFAGCTLRAAIQEANAFRGKDTIGFDIGGASEVKTISPSSDLPEITDPVIINGYTQPGVSENTSAEGPINAVLKIELDGTTAGGDGLRIESSGSVVRGLAINHFSNGIFINGTDARNNKVEGNFIGTDPGGTQARGNGQGVLIDGSSNTIGGTSPASRNIVSGNNFLGIIIGGDRNKIEGNLIGTEKDGASALSNHGEGVNLTGEASGNHRGYIFRGCQHDRL